MIVVKKVDVGNFCGFVMLPGIDVSSQVLPVTSVKILDNCLKSGAVKYCFPSILGAEEICLRKSVSITFVMPTAMTVMPSL